MKKRVFLLLTVGMLCCSCGSNSKKDDETPDVGRNIVEDNDFSQGFKLLEPMADGSRVFAPNINYGGEADGSPVWEMSQWSTPFNFKNAAFEKTSQGNYHYSNESRDCKIDVANKSLTMELNSWTEYQESLGHSRVGTEGWSHFLIEQSFPNPVKLINIKQAKAKIKFKINKSDNMDEAQAIPCSQFTWYFTVCDPKNGDPAYQSGDNTNDYMWFGIPFFDSRYDYLPENKMIDQGFGGSTNKLIYGIDNRNVFNEYVKVGKEYSINFDFFPYLKSAITYGMQNDCFVDSDYSDLVLNYMNIGWELPGSYDVSMTLSNISVFVEEK